jgi:hypothetical protein
MNAVKELSTYDVDRILVMNQMTHYLHLQQSAIAVGDQQGYKQQLTQAKERMADRLIAQAKERKAKQDENK